MNRTFTITRWQKALSVCLLSCAALLPSVDAQAQLSSNPDKFLGNITTRGQVESGGEKYHTLWNQITPENESKWSSIEGSRDRYNWGGCDNAYNYAKQHGFPFKFHTLVWGSQYPSWMDNLSATEQYKEIVEWMDAVKQRYPDLAMIDVVNEAVPGHAPAPYKAALGGDGKTGYDWIIKAFEMAYERWPDAILIYNDYNTFQWQRSQFIDLVKILRDAGAPVDAYGCQSHDLTDMNVTNFKSAMVEIQNALKMPMYSTEYDIGTSDDFLQLQRYKEQIPYMWEADYCAGITLWGYIYGATWTTDGNSGIIRNGTDRPAMAWLREYMQTDAAKNAKSPYPGMVKEASVYIKPASIAASKGEAMPITVRAKMKTKTIDHIDLYVKGKYYCTLTEAPYDTTYTPTVLGRYDLKAVVVATDSAKYERLGGFTAYTPRAPYKGKVATLPGTLQAENFDDGAEGFAYHDSDTKDEGNTSYRTGTGGVDIVNGNGGYAIGYTATGEWLEYTVNVTKAGYYTYDAYASSGVTTSSFSLSLRKGDDLIPLTSSLTVPCVTSNNWDNYRKLSGNLLVKLEEGEQVIRLNITGGSCNVDRVTFTQLKIDDDIQVNISANPAPAIINESTTIRVDASSPTSTIASVKLYVDNVLLETLTEAPFEVTFTPTEKRAYNISVLAIDAEGYESQKATYSLRANDIRSPFDGVISLPGVIEAENFDKGGDESTFHDKDAIDQGKTGYRTDNEGLDIITTTGGHAVGNTIPNEWMEYTVNVTDPGQYAYEATVSSTVTGSTFSIGLVNTDGTITNLCKVTIPNTGNKDTYKVVTGNLGSHLQAGEQILRFTINTALGNIDKVNLKCTQSTGIGVILTDPSAADAPLYTPAGVQTDYSYKGIVIKNGKKFFQK